MAPVNTSYTKFPVSVMTGRSPPAIRRTGRPKRARLPTVTPCPKRRTSTGTAHRSPMQSESLLSSTMMTLRRKLGEPGLIATVAGVGYRVATQPAGGDDE